MYCSLLLRNQGTSCILRIVKPLSGSRSNVTSPAQLGCFSLFVYDNSCSISPVESGVRCRSSSSSCWINRTPHDWAGFCPLIPPLPSILPFHPLILILLSHSTPHSHKILLLLCWERVKMSLSVDGSSFFRVA